MGVQLILNECVGVHHLRPYVLCVMLVLQLLSKIAAPPLQSCFVGSITVLCIDTVCQSKTLSVLCGVKRKHHASTDSMFNP